MGDVRLVKGRQEQVVASSAGGWPKGGMTCPHYLEQGTAGVIFYDGKPETPLSIEMGNL